jgi:hypothetical protein
MNTPKKKYKRKNVDSDEIIYTEEEAEYIGLINEKPYHDSEDDEDLDELLDSDSEEDEEDSEENSEEDEDDDLLNDKVDEKTSKKENKKEKYYVNPQEFDDEIVNYYDSGVMSDNLAQMVNKISHKLSFAPNFINYTYREEMVGDGIIRMFKALTSKKYDRTKGTNPFSYFTRIAFNAFRNRIKKEKHLRETHEKYQNELMLFSENYTTVTKNNQIKIARKNYQ